MFKKVLVVGFFTLFFNATIFALEENASQIMMPITAGTITLQNSDFAADGTAVVPIKNFGPSSCPSPYLAPAARYPWIMAYPSAYQVGHGVWKPIGGIGFDMFASNLPKPVTHISIIPNCNLTSCNLGIQFQYLYSNSGKALILPVTKDTCEYDCPYRDGYLTITYVAYCSTQPIQSDANKQEAELTKLK